MIEVELAGSRERVWPENPFGAAMGGRLPLYHQWLTHQASQSSRLTINTFPTGVGKTTAALLPLLDRHRDHDCLFLAPTNELLAQHARDARAFVEQAGLSHVVRRITAEEIDRLKGLPGISGIRRADRFHQFLQDPRAALGLDARRPLLLVMNPDLFYAQLFFRFNRLDRANLFRALFRFHYLIIDEFHYYNQKQFASFLFFLGILRDYGYFDAGHQVCLLSATPHPKLRDYLERLAVPTAEVSPDRPAPDLPTTPSLAPIRLRLFSTEERAGLEALIDRAEAGQIGRRLERGEHGAVISSALWRVNLVYDHLRAGGLENRMARMTGAENAASRELARSADFLIATPTVDVGYNFERADKARQSIDFLYFDARFADELVQRLGRAGRVLGKAVTDQPGDVVGIVPDEIYQAVQSLDGRRVPRAEFLAALRGLPHRHHLFSYLRSGAIGEAFLPIYHLYQMTAPDEREDVRRLYESVRELFAASSRLTFDRLLTKTRAFVKLEESLRGIEAPTDRNVARIADAFIQQNERDYHRTYSDLDRRRLIVEIKRPGSPMGESARDWLDERLQKYQVLKAAFSFREAFSAPEALIFDPEHLLASSDVSRYDVLHVATNYQARYFASNATWRSACARPETDDAAFYCALVGRRAPDERLRIGLHLEVDDDLATWEDRFLGVPRALRGTTLEIANGRLPSELLAGWADHYIVALALPEESRPAGQLKALARDAGIRIQTLSVGSTSDARQHRYVCALGTGALFAEAELRPSIHLWRRRESAGGATIIV
ncbi:MAG: type I-D CRISPR-associated helicase Cas3' [Chloroflexota bacterium]